MTQDQSRENSVGAGAHRNQPEPNGTLRWNAVCGAQLAQLRGMRGLSQRGLAELVGRSDRAVRDWEKGDSPPSPQSRGRLVEVLGGAADPVWDDGRFRELAVALGARRADGLPNGTAAPSARGTHDELSRPGSDLAPTSPDGGGAPSGPGSSRAGLWRRRTTLFAALCVAAVSLVFWVTHRHGDALVDLVPTTTGPWQLTYASGRVVPVTLTSRNGAFSWHAGPSDLVTRRVADFDADGNPEAVVVSLDVAVPQSPTGQVRIDRVNADGRVAWTAWLDDAPQYGGVTYAANVWSLQAVQFVDWDGDGRLETVVVATHTFFPSLLAIIDALGRRVRTYAHAGHICDLVTLPAGIIVGPAPAAAGLVPSRTRGVALALSVEYNDPPRCAGLVILPPGFARGALPTADARYRHDSLPPLATAHYVRFLPSLVAQRCPAGHNWPERLHYDAATKQFQLTTLEEPEGDGVIRYLDTQLRQLRVIPTDRFRHKYPVLAAQYGLPPLDSEAFAASVESVLVYQEGRWVGRRDRGAWQP